MNNIIIDGNYFFYKTLFVITGYAKKGESALDSEDHQNIFIRKVATDIAHSIRFFGSPNRIIFTIDSRSWRKDVEIEENEGYKAHRKQSTEINWDNFYKCMNEFAATMETKGWITSQVEAAEGDDLMYLWSQYFLKKKQNSIIITGDHDIHQTVRAGGDNWVVVFNPNSKSRRIYGQKGLSEFLAEKNETTSLDIFNPASFMKTGRDMINRALDRVELTELVPNDFLVNKVLMGDGGDGVPTVFSWVSKSKKGKETVNRLTPKRIEKIVDYVKKQINGPIRVFDMPDLAYHITKGIQIVTKQKEIDIDVIKSKIERNIKLMVLHKDVLPPEIISDFNTHFEERFNEPTLAGQTYDMHSLLEGTRFAKDPDSFQAGIFGQLDKKK